MTIQNIRSIGILNAIDGYNLTPIIDGEVFPVKIFITENEYQLVKGDKNKMKELALKKMLNS